MNRPPTTRSRHGSVRVVHSYLRHFLLLLPAMLAAVLLVGCQWHEPPPIHNAVLPASGIPVLVVPPVGVSPALKESGLKLGDILFEEVAAAAQGRAVYAPNSLDVKPLLVWEKLTNRGDLSIDEIRALGKAAQCTTAIAGFLLSVKPYAPQAISLNLVWIDIPSGKVLKRVLVNQDMRNPQVDKAFSAYIGTSRWYDDLNPVKDVGAASKDDQVYAASLMPALFQRFALHQGLIQLFAATEPAAAEPEFDTPHPRQ